MIMKWYVEGVGDGVDVDDKDLTYPKLKSRDSPSSGNGMISGLLTPLENNKF